MDGQLTYQIQAWNSTQSFQFTFAPHSAIAQVALAAKFDHDKWAVPIAHAIVAFTRATTKEGEVHLSEGITHAFVANDLSSVEGLLIADNCYAGAVVNLCFWPSVS